MRLFESLWLLSLCTLVYADTEIVNFRSKRLSKGSYSVNSAFPILSKANSTRMLSLIPSKHPIEKVHDEERPDGFCGSIGSICSGDLWLSLNLNEWFSSDPSDIGSEKGFTLRISWPASTPADIKLNIFDNLASEHGLLARIRASTERYRLASPSSGALLPYVPAGFLPSPQPPEPAPDVIFHVVVEPLIYGVLPESLLPGIALITILVIFIAVFALPWINAAFATLADRARSHKTKEE